jgi:hypothetical protein
MINYSKIPNSQLALKLKLHPILLNRIITKYNLVKSTQDVAEFINYKINLKKYNDGTDCE